MGIIDSLLDKKEAVERDTGVWKDHFRDVARFVLPSMAHREVTEVVSAAAGEPNAAYVSPELYDHTAIMAIDRLAAGEMSLVMPSNAHWHTLTKDDLFDDEPSDEEREFLDRLRNYLFRMRYNPKTGFQSASKAAIKSRCALGTGVIYVSERIGGGAVLPVSYRYVPLLENNLSANFEGVVDTNMRVFTRTAAQCVERWESKCSAKVRADAEEAGRANNPVKLLHAILPNREFTDRVNNFGWRSFYVEIDNRHMIDREGFFEFPFIVLHWNRETQAAYSEGPVSMALSEIKSLNLLSKEELLAAQQWVNPPTATTDDNHNRPDLSPGAPNPGLLNENGELLVKPIHMQANPSMARDVINARRDGLRDALYVNLWQILASDPQKSATEAVLRAQEKADLLGPSGLSLQNGLAPMIDREIGILGRKGAFSSGSRLEAPDSMADEAIGATFTGPLDRARRLPELNGIERTIQMAQILAEAGKPEALEKLDGDAIMDLTQEISGAPASIFKTDDEVREERAQKEQQVQAQQAIEQTAQMGAAAQQAGAGIGALQEAASRSAA